MRAVLVSLLVLLPGCPAPGVPRPGPGALDVVEQLRDLMQRRDMRGVVGLFTPQCRHGCRGFVPLVVAEGGSYQAASWVARLDGGYLLLDLARVLASYRELSVDLTPLRMRAFERRVLLRARLALQGIDGEGYRRVDEGLVDLDLRREPAGWRVHGMRPAQVSTLRVDEDMGYGTRPLPGLGPGVAPDRRELVLPGRYGVPPWAVLDADGDGMMDLVTARADRVLLLRGRGSLRFAEPVELARVVAVRVLRAGDLDGDGLLDLFVGCYGGRSHLLRNQGGGRFSPVSGFELTGHVTDATVADFDGDGRVDLYVVRHGDPGAPTGRGEPNLLLLAREGGGFRRSPAAADAGWGLAACAGDLDDDGRPDLFVANELGDSRLLFNRGGGRTGLQFDALPGFGGAATSCALGDVNNDGRLDLLVGGRQARDAYLFGRPGVGRPGDGILSGRGKPRHQGDALWINHGARRFTRQPLRDVGWTSWAGAVDHDSDGRLDLLLLRMQPDAGAERRWWWRVMGPLLRGRPPAPDDSARMAVGRPRLWVNLGHAVARCCRFADGAFVGQLPAAAGGVVHDLDGDARPELVLDGGQVPATVGWRGSQEQGHASLLRLVGRPPNHFAVGSRVEAVVEGRRQIREVGRSASGLPDGAPGHVHFGLGQAMRVERVVVRWPDGTRQRFVDLPGDRLVVLTQGGHADWGEGAVPAPAPPASSEPSGPEAPQPPASRPVGWQLPEQVLALEVVGAGGVPGRLSDFAGERGTVVLFVEQVDLDVCRRLARLLAGRKIGGVLVSTKQAPRRCSLPVVRASDETARALAGGRALLPLVAVVDGNGRTLRLVSGGGLGRRLLQGLER